MVANPVLTARVIGGAKDIPDACRYLGNISRARLYQMMQNGELKYVKLGARRVLLQVDLDAYLEQKLAETEGR